MFKKIYKLRERPESYRHKVAFFTAAALSLAIFISWAGAKGFISLPQGQVAYGPDIQNTSYQSKLGTGQAAAVSEAPSPLDNSINALKTAFSQFGDGFNSLKESFFNVFVPFISGIEVYESK